MHPLAKPHIQLVATTTNKQVHTMKHIYDFNRQPAQRNYTIHDLQQLKHTGKRLTMVNPANATKVRACVDAGIDLLTVWDRDLNMPRPLAIWYHYTNRCTNNVSPLYKPSMQQRQGSSSPTQNKALACMQTKSRN